MDTLSDHHNALERAVPVWLRQRASEETLRAILEMLPVFAWLAEAEGGCTFVNRHLRCFTGVELDEVRGSRWAELVHPGDRDAHVATYRQAVVERREFSIESRLRLATGAYRNFVFLGNPRWAADGSFIGFIGVVADVTDQRSTAVALARTQALYEEQAELLDLIFDNAADGIAVIEPNGELVGLNRAGARIVGLDALPRAEHDWEKVGSYYDPVELRELSVSELPLRTALGGRPVDDFQLLLRNDSRPEGIWLEVDARPLRDRNGEIRGAAAFFRDVTARRHLERAQARRDDILHVVRAGAERFLSDEPWEESLAVFVRELGEATGVCRVYVAEVEATADERLQVRRRAQWESAQPECDVASLPVHAWRRNAFDGLFERLRSGEMVALGRSTCTASQRAYLEANGVRSILCMPIVVDGQCWGYVSFDACAEERDWHPLEIEALRAAASIVRAGIVNIRAKETRLRLRATEERLAALERQTGVFGPGGELVGSSPPMRAAFERIRLAAASDASVLITGETGTGKELAARAIHALSRRATGPFVAVNCGALPESLLESELFGYVRGAFTGAVRDRKGLLAAADGGTLFLDEIGEMSPMLQVKLLRALQEGVVTQLGDVRAQPVDVRIISATNKDLAALRDRGVFREDFYYRIRVFEVSLPPLRDRSYDIDLLVKHFVDEIGRRTGKHVSGIEADALACLRRYSWPGNVRELRNAIEHAFVVLRGPTVRLVDLPSEVRSHVEEGASIETPCPRDEERQRIIETLRRCGGIRTAAAARLGISRVTLWKRMRRYGITERDFADESRP